MKNTTNKSSWFTVVQAQTMMAMLRLTPTGRVPAEWLLVMVLFAPPNRREMQD
jgi:hypothetical protein